MVFRCSTSDTIDAGRIDPILTKGLEIEELLDGKGKEKLTM